MGIVTKNTIVYVCHPTISGVLDSNIQNALAISRHIILNCPKTIPFTPYVSLHHYLDWNKLPERKLFMETLKSFFQNKMFDEMWVCGEEITPEVEMQIEWCVDNDISMLAYTNYLTMDLENIVQKIEHQKTFIN